MSYIQIKDLSKEIKGIKVLDNINLSLEENKIYGFFGKNASGKTMLFRAICGLIKPTKGEIYIDNKLLHKDIQFPPECGVIIESPGFWDNYTGFQNLKVLSMIKNVINDEDIINCLERIGLDPKDKKPYKKYSLGMKQKLSIAQAIMEKPKLIVLDEPTNSLDEGTVDLVRKILIEEKERGATILICSHNKEDIDMLSDSKFRISNGRLEYNLGESK